MLPRTRLGWLNYLVIRWSGYRLARVVLGHEGGTPVGWTFVRWPRAWSASP